MAVKVFIAGDVVPKDRTVALFKQKKINDLLGDNLISTINQSNIKIINLEAPVISGSPSPILKSGPNLYTNKETIEVLKDIGFNVITLANNHFRDQGENGIKDTIELIKSLGLQYVGGGYNYNEARKILYYKIENYCVAIINVCENEFSIATEENGGSNPMDIISIYYDINQAKKNADYVLLITHGGIENYQLPTPRMKKEYKFYIDCGADVVINHHQHCFSGYERYKGKLIFYGLGNFCFDWDGKRNSIWNKGYAITLFLDKNIDFKIHPYVQCDNLPSIVEINESFYNDEISKLNKIIINDKELYNKFKEYALLYEKVFLFNISPFKSRYYKALYKRGFIKRIYSLSKLLVLKNIISCESHKDVILEILKNNIDICKNKK